MSSANPYAPTQTMSTDDFGIEKVRVRPIELLKRANTLISGQYWMFLGIVVVGIIIGSAVPLGLIMGPMIVGIFLCYVQQESEHRVEFGTVFKGFDYFIESFVAFIVLFLVSMAVMLPFIIALFVIVFGPVIASAANNPNAPPPPPQIPVVIFILYPIMIIANMAVTLPFIFTFQLIADRKLKAIPAIKASARGVLKNFAGIVWFVIVIWCISLIAMMMCYFPAFLLMPFTFGAIFLLYRDIYGPSIRSAGPSPVGPHQGM